MKKLKTKLLIGFFVLMMFFTFLSNAVDAITIGKVQVEHLKQSELSFRISGTAKVKEKKLKKIRPEENYIIKEVKVKKGNRVKKGELLFTYNLEKLKEEKGKLKNELKKLELVYEKISLGTFDLGEEADLESLLLSQQYAKEELKLEKEKINHIKKVVKKEKQKSLKEIKDKLEEVKEKEDTIKKEQEAVRKSAERTIKDEELKLNELKKSLDIVKSLLDHYTDSILSKNNEKIALAEHSIFDYYYDKKYDAHLKEIKEAEVKYVRILEDEKDMEEKWDDIINPFDEYHNEESMREKYKQNVQARKEERKAAKRNIEDAKEKLDSLKGQDNTLSELLREYKTLLVQNKTSSITKNKENAILTFLCEDKIDLGKIEKEKKEVETIIERAIEDRNDSEENEEEKLEREEENRKELEKEKKNIELELEKIEAGTYDYQSDLEETYKGIREKKKALEDIEFQIKNTKKKELNQKKGKSHNKTINELELRSALVDLNEKREEIQKIEETLEKKGNVYSQIAGKVLSISFHRGSTITSADEILLSVKGYELEASVLKEELKYFDIGDEMLIKIGDQEERSVFIDEIKSADHNGNQIFTMDSPKKIENLKKGDIFEYSGIKKSTTYQQCVEIGALKEDAKGTYVLTIRENESVLGKENIAIRRSVVVLEQDSLVAAIQSDILEEDDIIVGSNKNISIGDRVRIDRQNVANE